MSAATISRPRATKRYAKFIKQGMSDAQAVTLLGRPDLVRPGDVAVELDTSKKAKKAKKGGVSLKKRPKSDRAVEKAGLRFTSGRVYVSAEINAAIGRVLETGNFEIVATSGVGRTSHVIITRTPGGDASVQNLRTA